MNEREFHERLHELGHSWPAEIAPATSCGAAEAREERLVRAVGDAIVRAAAGRRRARGRRRALVTLAAAAVLGGAVLAAQATRTTSAPAPVAVQPAPAVLGVRALLGNVTVQHGAGESVVQQAALTVGDAITVPGNSKAEVRLGDTVRADALGGSRVAILPEGQAAHRVRLDGGRLEARVDDHPSARPKLIVETPDVEVVVTGTVFDVDVAPRDGAATVTRVSVEKGRVIVRRHGVDVAQVTSGSSWTSEAPLAATAAASVRAAPSAPVTAPPRPERRAPAAALMGTPPAPSTGELADVRVGTLAEENALFQQGVDARKRGDDATLVDRMGELLTRFPGSPLAGEAQIERMRALSRLGRTEAAAHEARRYLAAHPDGVARDEAKEQALRSAPR